MSKNRRNHSPVFKSKVAMEALKERESLSELAEKYTLNAKQISQWKQELQKGSVELFKHKNSKSSKDQEALLPTICINKSASCNDDDLHVGLGFSPDREG